MILSDIFRNGQKNKEEDSGTDYREPVMNRVFREAGYLFTKEQVDQIADGLRKGLADEEVAEYARLCYTPAQMKKKKEKMLRKKSI